jgi:hypothetical protein
MLLLHGAGEGYRAVSKQRPGDLSGGAGEAATATGGPKKGIRSDPTPSRRAMSGSHPTNPALGIGQPIPCDVSIPFALWLSHLPSGAGVPLSLGAGVTYPLLRYAGISST